MTRLHDLQAVDEHHPARLPADSGEGKREGRPHDAPLGLGQAPEGHRAPMDERAEVVCTREVGHRQPVCTREQRTRGELDGLVGFRRHLVARPAHGGEQTSRGRQLFVGGTQTGSGPPHALLARLVLAPGGEVMVTRRDVLLDLA